ncbi:MAG TPA: DUF4339 domain-containing protein [Chthoniobacterales bacterium]
MSEPGENADSALAVYIARDGEELGSLWPEELEPRARAGDLRPNDYYWREGMEDWRRLDELLEPKAWLPLPAVELPPADPSTLRKSAPAAPSAPPASAPAATPNLKSKLITAAIVSCVVIVVLAIAIFFITRRDGAPPVRPRATASLDPSKVSEAERQAADDLRAKIDRLPAQAAAPLNTFYYDVAVDMRRSLAPHTTFEAMVHGSEDTIDPQSRGTVRHTAFRLTSGYRDGEWVFQQYFGSTKNLLDGSESQDEHDANTVAPPLIVTLLGLKIIPPEPERH